MMKGYTFSEADDIPWGLSGRGIFDREAPRPRNLFRRFPYYVDMSVRIRDR